MSPARLNIALLLFLFGALGIIFGFLPETSSPPGLPIFALLGPSGLVIGIRTLVRGDDDDDAEDDGDDDPGGTRTDSGAGPPSPPDGM